MLNSCPAVKNKTLTLPSVVFALCVQAFFLLAPALTAAVPAQAENFDSTVDLNVKARLPAANIRTDGSVAVSPVALNGGSHLTLIAPQRWSPLAARLSQSLVQTHKKFEGLFGEIPPFTTSLRLMDEEGFFMSTGAPRWTNALYFRGQIIIPVSAETEPDYDNLERSIKHEFTHAIIGALSNGRCPGWLDEGLAQWSEGEENPALFPALRTWLGQHPPVALSLLQGGFTKLDAAMVPAAYAQSLIAATTMNSSFGFAKLRSYLDQLKTGERKDLVFERVFGISEAIFEKRLARVIHERL